MTEPERDLVLAAALRSLRPPEHGEAFWDRLEHRLAEEELAATRAAVALRASPGTGLPSDPAPRTVAPAAIARMHRRSRRGRAGVIVVAALLLAGAAVVVAMVRGGDDAADTATGTTAPPSSTVLASTTTADDGATPHADEPPTPEVAVQRWVSALAKGDTRRAWELLGATSRFRVGGYDGLARMMAELGASFGDWDGVADLHTTVLPLAGPDGLQVDVVTLTGTTPDGPGAQAIPVRHTALGTLRVEPFSVESGKGVTITHPVGGAITPTDPVGGLVPEAAVDVAVGVDADPPVIAHSTAAGTGLAEVLHLPPSGSWAPGPHVVTLAFMTPDGTFAARAVRVEVNQK